MVYLVHAYVEFTARGKQINLPPLTKVTQPGDDKLLLVQAFIDPPGNLLHQSAKSLVSGARIATHYPAFRHLGAETR